MRMHESHLIRDLFGHGQMRRARFSWSDARDAPPVICLSCAGGVGPMGSGSGSGMGGAQGAGGPGVMGGQRLGGLGASTPGAVNQTAMLGRLGGAMGVGPSGPLANGARGRPRGYFVPGGVPLQGAMAGNMTRGFGGGPGAPMAYGPAPGMGVGAPGGMGPPGMGSPGTAAVPQQGGPPAGSTTPGGTAGRRRRH
jgi:hypothetical protein